MPRSDHRRRKIIDNENRLDTGSADFEPRRTDGAWACSIHSDWGDRLDHARATRADPIGGCRPYECRCTALLFGHLRNHIGIVGADRHSMGSGRGSRNLCNLALGLDAGFADRRRERFGDGGALVSAPTIRAT